MRGWVVAVLAGFAVSTALGAAQRTVRASEAWIKAPAEGATDAMLSLTIDNGTMYDVYVVAAETAVAGSVELRQTAAGKTAVIKESPVPAYGQLVLGADGVHLVLRQLKRKLTPGDSVVVSITFDTTSLEVEAVVK